MPTYYVSGAVRGSCGHRHRHIATAARCASKDHDDCTAVGGYSDRYNLHRCDGVEVDINEHDEFMFHLEA